MGLVRNAFSSSLRDSGRRSVAYDNGPPIISLLGESKEGSTHLNERSKRRILPLFPLKLVLSIQLMRTIRNERTEMRYMFQKDIADPINDCVRLLSFTERIAEAGVDSQDFADVPEYLLDECFASFGWYYFGFLQARHPCLEQF